MPKRELRRALGIVLAASFLCLIGLGCGKGGGSESSDGDTAEREEAFEDDTGESEEFSESLESDADKTDGDSSGAERSDESVLEQDVDQDKDSEHEVDADSGDTEAADESVVEQEEYVEREQSTDTWRDPLTGLVWQKVAKPDDPMPMVHDWTLKYCQLLTLDGGGWRLPSISELRSLIRDCPQTETGGACLITPTEFSRECKQGCDVHDKPQSYCNWPTELGGPCVEYWTSTTSNDETDAMTIGFRGGYIGWLVKESSAYYNGPLMRCVRDR